MLKPCKDGYDVTYYYEQIRAKGVHPIKAIELAEREARRILEETQ